MFVQRFLRFIRLYIFFNHLFVSSSEKGVITSDELEKDASGKCFKYDRGNDLNLEQLLPPHFIRSLEALCY